MPPAAPPAGPATPISLRAALRAATERLHAAGVPDAEVDAELLAGFVLDASRGAVQAAAVRGDDLDAEASTLLDQCIARRAAREPLQHITGLAPFRHLELRVGPGVFVPRPETEAVAQIAIDALRAAAGEAPIAVDLGTGSGAIALALATEVPHARVFAAEISDAAMVWTRQNFERWGGSHATLVQADLADAFGELHGSVSVVVSNPPYVPDDAIPRDPEVRLHDPALALYGGADGLDVVRAVSRTALRLAHPGGTVVIEHGEWQGAAIRELLSADGWRAAATHPDLTMRDRATTAIRP